MSRFTKSNEPKYKFAFGDVNMWEQEHRIRDAVKFISERFDNDTQDALQALVNRVLILWDERQPKATLVTSPGGASAAVSGETNLEDYGSCEACGGLFRWNKLKLVKYADGGRWYCAAHAPAYDYVEAVLAHESGIFRHYYYYRNRVEVNESGSPIAEEDKTHE